ncbi:MAG: NHLP bacteriocin export ABC transporter permease/ATPase subunit [Candidatus Muiribacteriota bacterium]
MIKESFIKSGQEVKIDGSHPVFMENSDVVYYVDSGGADIFYTLTDNDKLYDRRHFLSRFEKDEIFFSFDSGDKSQFIVTGLLNTRLYCMPVKEFIEKCSKDLLCKYIEKYFNKLSFFLCFDENNSKTTLIEKTGDLKVEKNTELRSLKELYWVKNCGIFKSYCCQEISNINQYEILPVSNKLNLKVADDGIIEVQKTSDVINNKNFINNLLNVLSLFKNLIIKKINENILEEVKKYNQSEKIDKQIRKESLNKLGKILNKTDKEYEGTSENSMVYVFEVVSKFTNTNLIDNALFITKEKEVSFQEMVRYSGVSTRKIVLENNFFNKDNGPVIAFFKNSKKPVALIPHSPSVYMVYEQGKSPYILNEIIGGSFSDYGYMIYPALSDKKITIKDLLSFAIKAGWDKDKYTIILMAALAGVIAIVSPIVTGQLIDKIIPQSDSSLLLTAAMLLISSVIAAFVFNMVRGFAFLRLEEKTDLTVQSAIWIRLLNLPATFFKKFNSADLAERAMGINKIRQILSGSSINSFIAAIFSVFNLLLMFYFNFKLGLLGTALVAGAVLFSGFFSYLNIKTRRKIIDLEVKISSIVFQILKGIAKIRIAGAEDRAFYKWSEKFKEKKELNFKQRKIGNIIKVFNSFFPVVASAIIFSFFILKGERDETTMLLKMSTGHFLAFNAAFTILLTAMLNLTESLISIFDIVPLFEKAKPILEKETEKKHGGIICTSLNGQIEASHISFRYEEKGEKILDDVSFHAKPGDFIAVVGPSGSGKSTLLRLLLGFEKAESGTVNYDDKDINKLDLKSLRNQLGVVLQNGQLLSGDIYNNIVGARQLSLTHAWRAAEEVGLADDIKNMPMGMHTIVSEGGGTLSGGQKQRILIAKALVHRPSVIFFDEATSALDNYTQNIVSESIEKLKATRIVIAHRLSTIKNADKIIVMDKGRVVEQGNYEELIKMNGIFKEIASRQVV